MRKNSLFWIFLGVGMFALISVVHVSMRETPKMKNAPREQRNPDDPSARLQHEWMMLRDPATNEIPRDIREKEMRFAEKLPSREQLQKPGDFPAASWVHRGPWNVGGRTRALGIDVGNPNLIIAGGVSGGMWRSVDAGATWTKTTVSNSLHSVSCLAQDTRTGQTATWYYGTGEFVGNSAAGAGAAYTGDGIFKSVNGGATWTLLPATSTGIPQTFDNFFDYVWNIVVDPATGNVYAATYGAIFRSTNGGTNWSVVFGGATPYSSLTDIQVASNGTLYATGSGEGGMAGVWRSASGNSGSWTNISPPDMLSSVRRIVLGIAPNNNNVVYALAETPSSGANNHSIWRYNGTTWTNRSANMPAFGGSVGNFDSQGSYDLVIKVKPDNENVVIIGGTNLYRSTDGFATSSNTTWIGGYSTANDVSLYANHHPDQHSLAFSPSSSSILYSGHDGGISRSANILATPHVWQAQSPGYLTTQFYHVSIDRATSGSNSILGGLQDNGTWLTTSSSSTATWSSQFSGDGAFSAIANGGLSRYVSAQNGLTYRLFSPFGSSNFTRVDPGGSGFLFINPFVLDPINSNIMYMSRGTTALRHPDLTTIPVGSNNPAPGWSSLSNSAMPDAISALAISSANPTNRLYIGTQGGNLKRVDGANTGNPTGVEVGGSLPVGYISCIAVDPTNSSRVMAVFSNYNLQSLWFTSDAGATWTDVEGNLAGASGPSCRSAVIVPVGGTTYYLVGTSTGLYLTTTLNGASTVWAQEGANTIGRVVVSWLEARGQTVIAATHANGVYSADITTNVGENGGVPSEFALYQNYPNPFNPSTKIQFAVPTRISNARLAIYDISGKIVWSKLYDELPAGNTEVVWNGETTSGAKVASGTYIYKLTAGNFSTSKRMLLLK